MCLIYFEWIHRSISILTTLQQRNNHIHYCVFKNLILFLFLYSLFHPFYISSFIHFRAFILRCTSFIVLYPPSIRHQLFLMTHFIHFRSKIIFGEKLAMKAVLLFWRYFITFCSLSPTLGCRWFHLWSLWRQALRWILVYLSYLHLKSLQVRYSSLWTLFHRGWWPNRSFEGLFECTLSFSFPSSLVSSRSRRYLCLQEWRSPLPVQGLVRWCCPFYSSISCWFTIDSLGSSR